MTREQRRQTRHQVRASLTAQARERNTARRVREVIERYGLTLAA